MMGQMPGPPNLPTDQAQLYNWNDLDPQIWKVFSFPVNIDVSCAVDGVGRGDAKLLNHRQFITKITHQVLGQTTDPQASGLYQDGQYLIDWKDQKNVFTIEGVQANNLFGPYQQGSFPSLPFPQYYAGVNTIMFTVTNLYTRTLIPASPTFRVQICLHGIADLSTGGSR